MHTAILFRSLLLVAGLLCATWATGAGAQAGPVLTAQPAAVAVTTTPLAPAL